MTIPSQDFAMRRSEVRERLAAINALRGDDYSEEIQAEERALNSEYELLERRTRSAIRAETKETDDVEAAHGGGDLHDGETSEFRALALRVKPRSYIDNVMGSFRSSTPRKLNLTGGAELEYNQAIGIEADQFPLRLIAGPMPEERAKTDTDIALAPRRWVDRLFADTAAMHLGIGMEAVSSGKVSYPITTAGGTPAQRGREEAADVSAWTISAVEFEPTRMSVHIVFANEDAMRVPGMEDALVRDIRSALIERMDYAIFNGDAGANEDTADIAGIFGLAGVTEVDITQANKVLAAGTLEAFSGMIDGLHAEKLSDLKIVTSVGATRLWLRTIANAAAENQTLGQFLMASGLSWKTRAGIDTATAADDYAAAVGLSRGIAGCGVCPVWEAAELVRDKWTGAKSGQVQLTLHAYWNWGLVRTSNFQVVKFAA